MTQNIPTPQADGRAARPALDPGIQAGQFAPTAIATYRQDWCAYTAWWEAVGAAALSGAPGPMAGASGQRDYSYYTLDSTSSAELESVASKWHN
jgi:hypothetical protein